MTTNHSQVAPSQSNLTRIRMALQPDMYANLTLRTRMHEPHPVRGLSRLQMTRYQPGAEYSGRFWRVSA